ncbi:MAG: alanine--tRNA ligase [Holophagales bacterium]|nr:MAG: alanine--tRNA ligase [Holophagales bacterium]
MKSHDIRQSFLDYFATRGHRLYPSAPLVPHGDATLLFTNAGMVQFKDFFLGRETPPARRAVSSQKCLRVSGKHNDLENVGPSPRHHTFFEMLGNFSFGDYFKAEAIEFGWELVTKVWGLPAEHLFASIYEEDDEAGELWRKLSSLPAGRIVRCGKADNFWAMGETGPCGPCSEIYVDRSPERPEVSWEEGTESGRYLEIWNLVFMQYERDAAGVMTPLPKPSIDTGAGLERVAAVLNRVPSNYDTDLFQPILGAAATLCGRRYGEKAEADVSLRVIADHLRALAFLLADGVIPGNEGRGYVLRRLLRRAVRHGMRLGFEEPFLHRVLPVVGEVLGAAYPELVATRGGSAETIRAEEEKFLATVASGARQVQEAIEGAKAAGVQVLGGEEVFRLYDTFGLPLELIREIAEEERFRLDEPGFEQALERQRERSRQHLSETQKRLGEIREKIKERGQNWEAVEFTGYLDLRGRDEGQRRLGEEAKALLSLSGDKPRAVSEPLVAGETGVAVFARTPFYAESGGQVGDRGRLVWPGGSARVTDVQKLSSYDYYHFLVVEEGTLGNNQVVDLVVDPAHRLPTQRNHTATHLLQAAMRKILGPGVRQAGSLVHPEHLRFDFTHSQALTDDERRAIEDQVNAWILEALPVRITYDRPIAEAIEAGAMALFGEKYGEKVRTVEVPGVSLELCGGCHVGNTGEIGPFVLLSEKAVASGVRRIEARTGEGALAHARRQAEVLGRIESALGVPAARAEEELATLRQKLRDLEREVGRLRVQMVSGGAAGAADEVEVDGIKVLAREVPPASAGELRTMADALRGKLGSGVVVLGARGEGKVTLLAAVTADLAGRLHAGRLVQVLAPLVGGSGGGRPDFAQAGGKAVDALPQALAAAAGAVRDQLAAG